MITFAHDAFHRFNCTIDVVQRLGLAINVVVRRSVAAKFIERRVDDLDRKHATRDLDDRRVVESF